MTTYNGFGSGANPGGAVFTNDGSSYTLGTLFYTTKTGQSVRAGRMWVDVASNGTNLRDYGIVFSLWSTGLTSHSATNGAEISRTVAESITTLGENAALAGWYEKSFAADIPIDANTYYVMAATVPGHIYSAKSNYFGSGISADLAAPSGAAGLFFPKDAGTTPNGQFNSGGQSVYPVPVLPPNDSFGSTFYGIDVVLNDTAAVSSGKTYWTGSAWVAKTPKTWQGSAWL